MRELTSAAQSLKEGYESLLEKHKELECEKKSLLAEIAALNWKVQELERNLEYGAKVVVKTAEKLYYEKQQNKRYREALEEIARGRFPGASYKARKALEESEVVFL